MMFFDITIHKFDIFMTLITFRPKKNTMAKISEMINIIIILKMTCFLLMIETPFILILLSMN